MSDDRERLIDEVTRLEILTDEYLAMLERTTSELEFLIGKHVPNVLRKSYSGTLVAERARALIAKADPKLVSLSQIKGDPKP